MAEVKNDWIHKINDFIQLFLSAKKNATGFSSLYRKNEPNIFFSPFIHHIYAILFFQKNAFNSIPARIFSLCVGHYDNLSILFRNDSFVPGNLIILPIA